MSRLAVICALASFSIVPSAAAQSCEASPVAVQVLGSGGPRVSRDRASASYLVWLAGRARILVDAGGGAYLRFGESGASLDDLSLIAISHLHPDHVSDLPALFWSIDQTRKDPPLPIAGPSGNDLVPGFETFLKVVFDQTNGAFRVLGGMVGGSGRGVPLEVMVTDVKKGEPSMVFNRQGITVTAIGIPHGDIPALAYRVQAQTSRSSSAPIKMALTRALWSLRVARTFWSCTWPLPQAPPAPFTPPLRSSVASRKMHTWGDWSSVTSASSI